MQRPIFKASQAIGHNMWRSRALVGCRSVLRTVVLSIALASAGATYADAAVLYDNPFDNSVQIGACDWNTACGTGSAISPGGYFGDDFAAQAFSLSSEAIITSASATELADYYFLDSINWAFYSANGPGGLPGTLLASGSSYLYSEILGFDNFGDAIVQDSFSVGSVSLSAGSFYFAVQGVSADPDQVDNYLGQGVEPTGAAETMDGGQTWVANYASDPRSGYISSVAVSLEGQAVPEPATWAMMSLGFAWLGEWMRRARRTSGEGISESVRSLADC